MTSWSVHSWARSFSSIPLYPTIRIRMDSFVLSFPVVGNRGVVVGDPSFVGGIVVTVAEIEKLNRLDAQCLVTVANSGWN
jgi:hypothetical protein